MPWPLRFFDQIRFYPVTTEELQELRRDILHGAFDPRIEEMRIQPGAISRVSRFDPAGALPRSRSGRTQAFREERERWRVNGQLDAAGAGGDA